MTNDPTEIFIFSVKYKVSNGEIREIKRRVTLEEADKMLLDVLKIGTIMKSCIKKDSPMTQDFSIRKITENKPTNNRTKPIVKKTVRRSFSFGPALSIAM